MIASNDANQYLLQLVYWITAMLDYNVLNAVNYLRCLDISVNNIFNLFYKMWGKPLKPIPNKLQLCKETDQQSLEMTKRFVKG